MTAHDLAAQHSRTHVIGKGLVCKCGHVVGGGMDSEDRLWLAHVIEVVREQIAAEIEAQANDYLALAPTGTFETSRHNGLTAAARIARGEVTP